MKTINPATEEVLAEYSLHSPAVVQEKLKQSSMAFAQWRKVSLRERVRGIERLEIGLHGARVELADLMTREMGKPRRDSQSEIDKCVASCQTLRELYPRWQSELEYSLTTGFSVTREPMGVLLGIMPWNFPLWQVLRFAVPAILSGNSVLIKHAPSTWGSAAWIEKLFAAALPAGLYLDLRIEVPMISAIIADPRVRGVSLTGSRGAGSEVGKLAGANLKKCVLELGGSDAYVILDDADLELAAKVCATSRLLNAGQSCVSAKRFIVTGRNEKEFVQRFKAILAGKKFGDPMQEKADFGPLARQDLRSKLHAQVEASVSKGAILALGGRIPEGKGYFYPATLLTGVKPGQPAFDEELFGPVAAVIIADNEDHAIRLCNQSLYGLGGAVFSRDMARAQTLARTEIQAGMVFINDFVRSDATVPFGGVKDSGLGRELGREGAFEFTDVKTVFTAKN